MSRGAINIHGVCVAVAGRGALLRGRPGSLKSDLALRFLAHYDGAALVADDQVLVAPGAGATLVARCPRAIAGKLEVRGLGIVDVRHAAEAGLVLLVDLVSGAGSVERMPPDPAPREALCGISLPVMRLDPREASAPFKLKLALTGSL